MTQTEKDLLLNDLCARLPYGVKISIPDLWTHDREIEILDEIFKGDDGLYRVNSKGQLIEHIKPYLLPISSMTYEQKEKYCQFRDKLFFNNKVPPRKDVTEFINFFYENNLDFNGLIPMRLAIDATDLNVY